MNPNLNPLQPTQAQLDANSKIYKTKQGTSLGEFVDSLGSALALPEIGLSEFLNGGKQTANTDNPVGVVWNMPSSASKDIYPANGFNTGSTTNNTGTNSSVLNSSSIGGQYTPSYTAADEAAYRQDQINTLNDLLGFINTQKEAGLSNLRSQYEASKAKGLQSYDEQSTQNEQAKQKGIESVGQFANDSLSNLRRLLQGANAGSSSVARELAPYLVSKAAGTRRQGVFDTAGENTRNITTARSQFEQDQENERKAQEQSLLQSFGTKQNEIESEKMNAEIAKAQASGLGYAQARQAGDATRASIASRQAELANLFGQYKPTYSTAKTPDLSTFTVDKANISANGNTPTESNYYLPQVKKLKELLG